MIDRRPFFTLTQGSLTRVTLGLALLATTPSALGQDWPMWGRDITRNMVSDVTGLPKDFVIGGYVGKTDEIDLAQTKNIKWVAKLGSQTYGNPTVSGGVIFVGTNNDSPRDDRMVGDRSVVNAFDEATGELLWQLNIPKLGTGKVSDWEFLGICCSPCVEGDKVWLVTNRCELMCIDKNGMADGNDGPFQDEGQYMAGPGKEPLEVTSTDADILWSLNMIDECGVFPHNITSSSPLVVGDRVWVATSNGVDYGHVETPAPFAPCLIVADKNTGELLGEESSGLSQRIFHSNWVSPAYLQTDDLSYAIFGGPDGWVYAFSPETEEDEDGFKILKEGWRFDANLPEYRTKPDGTPRKYATRAGPSEVLGTPVVYNEKVYAVIGQDPEHGEGVGRLVCIDPTGNGDITPNGLVWSYDEINRSLSTLSVANDLVFAADYSGFIYCLDAKTGELYWKHDTFAHIWGSTLVVDGRVFVGNEDGILTSIPATKEFDSGNVVEINMASPIFSSPIAANGVLYVATFTHLFAIASTEDASAGEDRAGK